MKTSEPRIGQVFAEWMVEQNDAEGEAHRAKRPEGMPTFSFSAVMGCSRAAGYKAAGLPATDPMDGASLAITNMGRVLHTDMQDAVAKRWPNATFEGHSVVDDLIWGYYDIDDPDADESIELKTVGAYKFDLSIGLFRSPGRGKPAFMKPAGGQGPSKSHICQGGLNARGKGRSNVRIVYLSREAVSVKKAEEAGLDSIGRFWAEWVFGREVWEPLVDAELIRLAKIRDLVVGGILPDRSDLDDDGKTVKINRDTWWRCKYCPQAQRCVVDGPGRIPVELSREANP
jgi:hypothetical protein